MDVLVVHHLVRAGNVLIETHDGELFFPSVLEQARGLGAFIMPQSGGQRFHAALILHRKNEQWRAGRKPHVGKSNGEHGTHLFELARYSSALTVAAVGKNPKIWAADFGQRLYFSESWCATQKRQDSDEHYGFAGM